MQESALLRRWLFAHKMSLSSEKLVREGKHIYEIMVVRQGRQTLDNPLFFELGPCLIRQRDPLLQPFIKQKIYRCRAIAEALQKSGCSDSRLKQSYYQKQERRLKEVLEYVGNRQDHCRLS
jgi:tRNA (adenine22-N1)-methyltransferase